MTSNRHLPFYGGGQGRFDNVDDWQGLNENESPFAMMTQLTKMLTDQQTAFNKFLQETAQIEKTIQAKVTAIQEEVTTL